MHLVSFLSVALMATSAVAQTNQISGTLRMPPGVVPVSSPAVFRIQTLPLESLRLPNGQQVQTSVVVTIPRFGNSTNYSLPLKDISVAIPAAQRLRKIQFECLSGCANIAMTSVGFWSNTQGVVSEANASQYDSAFAQQVSLQLERGDLFAGIIEFPEGIEASGDETFSVQLRGSQFSNPATFTQRVATTAGQRRWAFFVGVPPDETGGSWSIRLDCESCDDAVFPDPLFASSRAGAPLVAEAAQRFLFLKGRNYTNLRLSIPEIPEPPDLPERSNASAVPAIITLLLD